MLLEHSAILLICIKRQFIFSLLIEWPFKTGFTVYNSTDYFETELPHLQMRQFPRVWSLWQTNAQPGQSICTVSPPKHSLLAYTKYGRNRTSRESKKEGKDQESILSSTTPDPGYQWKSDNFTIRHHKREPRGHPFPSK